MKKGKLYIVPTPIGNLKDITYRAVEKLREVDLIAAEDTRNSATLLNNYDIKTGMLSYHKFNEKARVEKFLNYLTSGKDLAVISDAGTPGISDPCKILVDACIENGVDIIPLPGASAFLAALSACGLKMDKFMFLGFLPKREKRKNEMLERYKEYQETLIFYESPRRVLKTLDSIKNIWGDRNTVVAKEISKIYEQFFRGKISEVKSGLNEKNLKGEFVILVEGAQEKEITDERIAELLQKRLSKGERKKTAVKYVTRKYSLPKNRVYDISLKI